MSWLRRQQLPAEPPSVGELAAQRQAEAHALEVQFRRFVSERLAPHINAMLRSSKVVSRSVGDYFLIGNCRGVSVSAGSGPALGWVTSLAELLTPMYAQYVVGASGQWRVEGVRYDEPDIRSQQISAPVTVEKLLELHRAHPGLQFYVSIAPPR